MKFPRRQFLQLAAGAAALPIVSRAARAQVYPSRPVRLISPFPAGSGNDVLARLIGQWLSERLGQQFFVENRPGAGGNIGTELVVRATPDGYTLLVAGAYNAINVTFYENLSFSFVRDIAPVAGLISVPNVLEINPSFPAKSVPELINYGKANPGKLTMAASGIGTAPHVSSELFRMMTGIDLIYVPYRGGASALPDLLSGQLQIVFDNLPSSFELIKSGKLTPLAVTTASRSQVLPEVPAMSEFLPGYEAAAWFGIGAPKNTPTEFTDKLNKEINLAFLDPRMKARFSDLGGTTLGGAPADFGRFIAAETEKWAKVVKSAGIKPE